MGTSIFSKSLLHGRNLSRANIMHTMNNIVANYDASLVFHISNYLYIIIQEIQRKWQGIQCWTRQMVCHNIIGCFKWILVMIKNQFMKMESIIIAPLSISYNLGTWKLVYFLKSMLKCPNVKPIVAHVVVSLNIITHWKQWCQSGMSLSGIDIWALQ